MLCSNRLSRQPEWPIRPGFDLDGVGYEIQERRREIRGEKKITGKIFGGADASPTRSFGVWKGKEKEKRSGVRAEVCLLGR